MCPVGAEVSKDSRRPKLNVNRQAICLKAVLTITTVPILLRFRLNKNKSKIMIMINPPIPSYHSKFFHRSSGLSQNMLHDGKDTVQLVYHQT